MDCKTKHRIVGATVVIALLGLLTLFVHKKNDPLLVEIEHGSFRAMKSSNNIYEEEMTSLPNRFVISGNKSIGKKQDAKGSASQRSHSKQVLDDNQSTTWIIQLASFANDNNATKLVDVLRRQGYNAYTENAVNANDLVVTRVFIGPQIRHKYAENLVSQLANEFGLDGMVIKNNPLDD